jgi:hypothetical protein
MSGTGAKRRQRTTAIVRHATAVVALGVATYVVVWSYLAPTAGEEGTSAVNAATIWALAIGVVGVVLSVLTTIYRRHDDASPSDRVRIWHCKIRDVESKRRTSLLGDTTEFANSRLVPNLEGLRSRSAATSGVDLRSLPSFYASLPLRRLVILGAGGSGKTLAAIQILVEMSSTLADEKLLPIRFSLSEWDTEIPFEKWLAAHLEEQDLPSALTDDLITSRRLVPRSRRSG